MDFLDPSEGGKGAIMAGGAVLMATMVAYRSSKETMNALTALTLAFMFMVGNISPLFELQFRGPRVFRILANLLVVMGALIGAMGAVHLPEVALALTTGIAVNLTLSGFGWIELSSSSGVSLLVPWLVIGLSALLTFFVKWSDGYLCKIRDILVFSLVAVATPCWLLEANHLRDMCMALNCITEADSSDPPLPGPSAYLADRIPLSIFLVCAAAFFLAECCAGWTSSSEALQGAPKPKPQVFEKSIRLSEEDVVNYVNFDSLPAPLRSLGSESIQELAYKVCLKLGFQMHNCMNQSEHLIMLLMNEAGQDEMATKETAVQYLHQRLLRNYNNWCKAIGVDPHTKIPSEEVDCTPRYIVELLIFLMVWGEAANLRHLPECLCFIYHKMLSLYDSDKSHRGAERGSFLDKVVTPMYNIISEAAKKPGDHSGRLNYDDFNELFWSSKCASYEFSTAFELTEQEAVERGIVSMSRTGSTQDYVPTIMASTELGNARKTYLERRSWLHPLLSMHRVFDWLLLTYTILAVISFSNFLQWRMVFTLQVASFVFWEISFLGIVWTLLEMWVEPPESLRNGPRVFSYMVRILAGFLILTYQSIYYQWAFISREEVAGRSPLNWWWQYIWLSLLSCSIYFIQSLLVFFPTLTDAILCWKNDFVQSVLFFFYPNSQLYVGKRTAVPQMQVMKYIAFWLPLLAFKLWFGYYFIANPMCTPTIQIYDDYMNFTKYSFLKTSLLIFLWWFPHFLVYCIDLSIWYAVWSSFIGGCEAIYMRIGEIRNRSTFTQHFLEAPSMLGKLANIQPSDALRSEREQFVFVHHGADTAGFLQPNLNGSQFPAQQLSSTHQPTERSQLSGQIASLRGNYGSMSSASTNLRSFDVRSASVDSKSEFPAAKSRALRLSFAKLWNEFVARLRNQDQINNQERDWIIMRVVDKHPEGFCMPLLVTTGLVGIALNAFHETSSNLPTDAASDPEAASSQHGRNAVFKDFQAEIGSHPLLVHAVKESFLLTASIMQKLLFTDEAEEKSKFVAIEKTIENMTANELLEGFSSKHINEVYARISSVTALLAKRAKSRQPVVPQQGAHKASSKQYPKEEPSNATPPVEGGMKRSRSSELLRKAASANFPDVDLNLTKFYRKEEDPHYCFDDLRDQLREELTKAFKALAASDKKKIVSPLVFDVMNSPFFTDDIYASARLNECCANQVMQGLFSHLTTLLTTPSTQVYIKSEEASRRINFFMSTLFMDFPSVKAISQSRSHSTITPFYKEEVLLNRDDLLHMREDGLTLLLYLQTLYKDDWSNFRERLGIESEGALWTEHNFGELRKWASLRAQTLYRTVEGIMTNEDAYVLLAEAEGQAGKWAKSQVCYKFNYVVACQAYGEFKRTANSKYKDIDALLRNYPNLRVAYIDCRENYSSRSSDMKDYYSVLIRFDEKSGNIVEVYRIKLPGNPILGEGKPENQNHAIIFTRGRYLQAIDMNQEGYFEDSLKMKNLLEEFDRDGKCAIVGFREHIFTGSVSSIANFMALQELSFVTLGQRVLANPLCIRQHYGHPDVFDKFFVMTEGGMSKASKGINLSEDVFAGFNATIRGHTVKFVEYVCAGKGRDIGLQQTYLFEAKLAQGNAEQSLSRDVDRIFNRLDFFRMLSFYFGGIGHYLSNTLVMFCLIVVVYTMLGQAIYDEEGVNGRAMLPEGVLQLALAGMGILQTLPLFVTLSVEKSFRFACFETAKLFLSGGPLYFIFQIQTKSYYFAQTIMAGGATYHATGRGFVTQHTRFSEVYRFFATSHIYLGFDLILALIIFFFYTKSTQYAGLTWSLWMAAGTFYFGPFWFNPLSFEWSHLHEDFREWRLWMEESLGSASQSWKVWWQNEIKYLRNLSFSWKLILFAQKSVLWAVIGWGLVGKSLIKSHRDKTTVSSILGLIICFCLRNPVLHMISSKCGLSYSAQRYQRWLVETLLYVSLLYVYGTHARTFLYTVALYYFAMALAFLFILLGQESLAAPLCKLNDEIIGFSVFMVLSLGTLLQLNSVQSWLLFYNALSRDIPIMSFLDRSRREAQATSASKQVTTAEQVQHNEMRKNMVAETRATSEMEPLLNKGKEETIAPGTV